MTSGPSTAGSASRSWRSSSLPAHAAWICPVGSSVVNSSRSLRHCLSDRCRAPRSQQPAVGPAVVGLAAAVAVDLLGDPLPGLGHHQVRQPVQMPVVHHQRRVRQHVAQRGGERRGRVDRDDLDAVPELPASAGQASPGRSLRTGQAPARAARPGGSGPGRRTTGHPRVGAAPAVLGEQPPDRPGPGLIDPEHPHPGTAPAASCSRPSRPARCSPTTTTPRTPGRRPRPTGSSRTRRARAARAAGGSTAARPRSARWSQRTSAAGTAVRGTPNGAGPSTAATAAGHAAGP